MTTPAPRPAPGHQRIIALDAVRGLATLGVMFAYAVWNLGGPPRETWNAFDRAVAFVFDVFVDVKFLSMFSFLFGLGITQQWKRWEAASADPAFLHVRRMLFLFAIGIAHAFLLRNGDILAPYALLGLLLLLFRGWSSKALVVAAIVLFVAPYVARWLIMTSEIPWPVRPATESGNYLTDNLAWLRYWYATNPVTVWPALLATMLAGMLAGRAGLIERMASDRQLTRRTLAIAFMSAVLSWLMLAAVGVLVRGDSVARTTTLNGLYHLNALAFAATYASGAILLVHRSSRVVNTLRVMGRLAFTNYLGQAMIVVPLCLIAGWFDRITPGRGLLIGLGTAVVQVAFSHWWLQHHESGPFERLWRNATYGAVPSGVPVVAPPT